MMAYAILALDRPGSSAARAAARPEHLKRLETLQNAGRMLLAGPFPNAEHPDATAPGFQGSLIVAEFPSLQDAQSWVQADPYSKAEVYSSVQVFPFKPVFPQ